MTEPARLLPGVIDLVRPRITLRSWPAAAIAVELCTTSQELCTTSQET